MSKSCQTPWVRVLAYDYTAGYSVPLHHHEEHQLIYAKRGIMAVSTSGGTWIVPPQRAVWVPRRQKHSIEMSGRVEMRTLYFNSRAVFLDCRVVEVSPLLRELILHIVEREGLSRTSRLDRSRLALLNSELRAASTPGVYLPHPDDPRLREVTARLRQRPDKHRDHRYLSGGTGVSLRTLQRLCVRETGMPFGQYARQVRLMRSLELLALGRSVTAVGLDCGYESTSAFISTFRRRFGVTPGRYFGAFAPAPPR